jgi:hypothetical protein
LLSELQELTRESAHITTRISPCEEQERPHFSGEQAYGKVPETPEEKIDLFIQLFRCREEVFPHYWENKRTGKSGYSPVCENEWKKGVCFKPKVECRRCSNQAFLPFDFEAVRDHLTGRTAMGSYAITEEDTCLFLAADFDKSTWKEDVAAYRTAAAEMNVEVATEISKSGNGAHAWIFFNTHVPAGKARKLGEIILSKAMSMQTTLNLDSYDRFFPNQDLMPSGGFGNLIALPLQKQYRSNGTCVFIDEDSNPYPDQWEYLSRLQRLSEQDLDTLLYEADFTKYLIEDDEMMAAESIVKRTDELGDEEYTGTITVKLKGQVALRLSELPLKMVLELKKMATFANPKYFEAQRMRFSTWNIPKYIFCGDDDDDYMYLPRGLATDIEDTLTKAGFEVKMEDLRNDNEPLELRFSGNLYDFQETTIDHLYNEENSVLVAPTGTGKTIMAIYMMTARKRNTLILVHRSTLIEQWMSSICEFIPEIERKDIGVLGAGRKKLKGKIDIAMLQSMANIEDLEEKTKGYDFLIIDECHRVPTVTFEPVLKSINARYVLGLTATPQRKDRFEKIIFMQCGPIAYTVEDINLQNQERKVFFRNTTISELGNVSSIQRLWNYLTESEERNDQILTDIMRLLEEGRSPLIISDRTEHIEELSQNLREHSDTPVYILKGSVGKKERGRIFDSLREHISSGSTYCLFATGSLLGEGFDLPELDTMVITMPISFKGRLTQYVGRLHRQNSPGKKEIVVYDYVDTCSGMTISMFKKRLSAYRKLGYAAMYNPADKLARWI